MAAASCGIVIGGEIVAPYSRDALSGGDSSMVNRRERIGNGENAETRLSSHQNKCVPQSRGGDAGNGEVFYGDRRRR